MLKAIGKFQVRRLLGKGAQSAVYLAHDPRVQRDVAIKVLQAANGAGGQTQALLSEARMVGQLRHENIVPIYDADVQGGVPYLVFEYVPGGTLAQIIREQGPLEVHRAAGLMAAILGGIEHAHGQGIVHRDLKPSNILIAQDGQPRVMDFGIAMRVSRHTGAPSELTGTPAYMAPEYVANGIVGPQGDVFAAGMILYEMIFGRRAVQTDNVFEALHRIAHDPIVYPPDAAQRIDEAMFDILAKATAREPHLRYESARQMREALLAYLKPAPDPASAAGKSGPATLEFLLRRMRHKSDFPAMSSAIRAVNRMAASERSSAASVSNAILKDFALTNKLLRVANSVYYRPSSGPSISTVSRAIVVLGLDAVRNIAISLMLFEHLQDKKHAETLKEEFLRANLGGVLAKDIAARLDVRDTEEFFICGLFHQLGRLLTQYYFPKEAGAIGRLVRDEKIEDDAAAVRVLGIGYEDLGVGVAQAWGFPDTLVNSLRKLPDGPLAPPVSRGDQLRCVSGLSSALRAAVERSAPGGGAPDLGPLLKRFGKALPIPGRELERIVGKAAGELEELAKTLHLDLRHTALGARLLPPAPAAAQAAATTAKATTIPGHLADQGPAEAAESADAAAPGAPPPDALALLTAGIRDISQALVEDVAPGDLLGIIAETLYRAIGFQRVLIGVRDARGAQMGARFGFGAQVDDAVRRFRFDLDGGSDLFQIILRRNVDVLISDAREAKIQRNLPDWYRRQFTAQTFIVLPMQIKGQPVAMVYADGERAGSIRVTEKELSLMRTLRNQALLAVKQLG